MHIDSRPEPTQEILEQAIDCWGLSETPVLLRKVENFVYNTSDLSGPKILRLTEPRQRKFIEVEAELDWVSFLNKSVEEVVKATASKNGQLVQEIVAGDQKYFATLFEYAEGVSYNNAFEMASQVYQTWGALLAKLHKATMNYAPSTSITPRGDWTTDRGVLEAKRWAESLGESGKIVEFERWFSTLPKARNVYGLVHRDAHYGNFHVDNGKITLFDFDDCCYHWFSFDIAVTLVHLKYEASLKSCPDQFEDAKARILTGYLSENTLDQVWIDRVDLMLAYHMMILNYWCYGHTQKNEIGEHGVKWCQNYVDWYASNSISAPNFI